MKKNAMKDIREGKKISIKTVSEETGLSLRYLYFIENGQRSPSMKAAKKISTVLGKSIDEIFFTNE